MSQTTADKKTLLVAEDNPVNQRVIIRLLKRMGLSADMANNGVEAVELWERNHHAIILMDLQMPIMDGIAATQMIRKHNDEQATPPVIIVLTAHSETSIIDSCLQHGMDDFLLKPYNFEELSQKLETYLI